LLFQHYFEVCFLIHLTECHSAAAEAERNQLREENKKLVEEKQKLAEEKKKLEDERAKWERRATKARSDLEGEFIFSSFSFTCKKYSLTFFVIYQPRRRAWRPNF
jgi:uncharacterized protein YlxW (UPF0749 family)